jgi:hypothetical protein
VQLVLDHRVLATCDGEASETVPDKLWFHPMQNDHSTALTRDCLRRFLDVVKHAPITIDLGEC